MRAALTLAAVLLYAASLLAQTTPQSQPAAQTPEPPKANPWAYSLTVDGYIVPDDTGYASPIFTADHNWLHLEARYNDEELRTASLWVGYNFSAGKKVKLTLTPMIGGVFGRVDGIAPGLEATVSWWKLQFYIANEYVFDTTAKSGNFYYSWPQLSYAPVSWFRIGAVAQHTKAYRTPVALQRGFLVGFSHKALEFTTYVFNPELSQPTVVLEVGATF